MHTPRRGRPPRTDSRSLWVTHLPEELHRDARKLAVDFHTLGDWMSEEVLHRDLSDLRLRRTHPRSSDANWPHVRFQVSHEADRALQRLLRLHDISRAGLLYSIVQHIVGDSRPC
jgi:hypothetical protein